MLPTVGFMGGFFLFCYSFFSILFIVVASSPLFKACSVSPNTRREAGPSNEKANLTKTIP